MLDARHHRILAVALLFILLGCASMWPVMSDPARLSLGGPSNNDFHFNKFVVLWGAHALTTAPLELHHTNMFWPERYTFAYSDMELSHSLLVMPLLALWYNPTLAINALLLMSMAIGGTGAFVLARRCLRSDAAALLAALVFVFNDAHFARHLQIQFFGDHWAPWLAWTTLRWIDRPTPGRAMATAAFFLLHALTGSHNAVFATVIVGTITCARLLQTGQWRDRRFWTTTIAFALPVLVVLVPLFYPYLIVQERLAHERGGSYEILLEGSARTRDLLTGASRFHGWLDERFGWPSAFTGDRLRAHLFPGFIPLLLALIATLPAGARSGRASVGGRDRLTWLLLVLLCLLLALGPRFGLYQILAALPGIKLIRVPSRFILPGLLGLAMLAGFGWRALAHNLRARFGRRTAQASFVAVLLLFAGESVFAPLDVAIVEPGPDPIAAWIAAQPGDFAVLELPVEVDNLTIHVRQVRQSQYHWKRLLVGYSGWRSVEVAERLGRIRALFPRRRLLDELAELDVRFIVVLENRVDAERLSAIEEEPRLRLAAALDGVSIWQLDPERWPAVVELQR